MLSYLCFVILLPVAYGFQQACYDHCQKTYPLHTSDKVESCRACLTGCRLKHLSQFSEDASKSCDTDCTVFSTKDLQYACSVGCSVKQKQSLLPDVERLSHFELRWQVQLMHPVFVMKNMCSGFFHRATTYVSTSYVDKDGGKNFFMLMQYSPMDDSDEDQTSDVSQPSVEDTSEHSIIKKYAKHAYEHTTKWFKCVESKTGIPSYAHLVMLLFLSLLFISWVCCATCDDQEDSETYSSKKKFGFQNELSVNSGDIERLALYTLVQDDENAPMLPTKAPK